MKERMYGKKDIMRIFGMKSDWALKFLRFAKVNGSGIQIGKEYFISDDRLEAMMEQYMGLKSELPA